MKWHNCKLFLKLTTTKNKVPDLAVKDDNINAMLMETIWIWTDVKIKL